jgi:hypothetical protein
MTTSSLRRIDLSYGISAALHRYDERELAASQDYTVKLLQYDGNAWNQTGAVIPEKRLAQARSESRGLEISNRYVTAKQR